MTRRIHHLVAAYTAPALLVGLALFYSWLVVDEGYDLWKGPNFGMFATLDGSGKRLAKCHVLDGQRQRLIECPEELRGDLARLHLVPNDQRMAAATRRLWQVVTDTSPQVTGVRLELWEFDYRRDSKEIVFRKRADLSMPEAGDE